MKKSRRLRAPLEVSNAITMGRELLRAYEQLVEHTADDCEKQLAARRELCRTERNAYAEAHAKEIQHLDQIHAEKVQEMHLKEEICAAQLQIQLSRAELAAVHDGASTASGVRGGATSVSHARCNFDGTPLIVSPATPKFIGLQESK